MSSICSLYLFHKLTLCSSTKSAAMSKQLLNSDKSGTTWLYVCENWPKILYTSRLHRTQRLKSFLGKVQVNIGMILLDL